MNEQQREQQQREQQAAQILASARTGGSQYLALLRSSGAMSQPESMPRRRRHGLLRTLRALWRYLLGARA